MHSSLRRWPVRVGITVKSDLIHLREKEGRVVLVSWVESDGHVSHLSGGLSVLKIVQILRRV